MKIGLIGLGVALAFSVGTAALAFDEQKGSVTAPPAGQAPAQAAPDAAKELGLSGDQVDPAKTVQGTEIRIPGLGKLGVLPKMDFGLELLYGAAETKQPDVPAQQTEPTPDDLTIRGSVKHRF